MCELPVDFFKQRYPQLYSEAPLRQVSSQACQLQSLHFFFFLKKVTHVVLINRTTRASPPPPKKNCYSFYHPHQYLSLLPMPKSQVFSLLVLPRSGQVTSQSLEFR